jgi:catechol 2,3-dioxygenase-like lactoylglutathione lyase family enzyme
MPEPGYDPGPQIAHAGSVHLGTPDLEKSLGFFRDLLGMEVVEEADGTAYLRGYQELTHHSLILSRSDVAQVFGYSLRVKRPQDVELFAKEFAQQGITTVEIPKGRVKGRGEAVRFLLPGGDHPLELYYDIEKPAAPAEISSKILSNSSRRRGLGLRRLDHLNIQTSPETVNEAEGWLREALGFRRREILRVEDMLIASWLSVTPQVHDIAIGMAATPGTGQMHHIAFNFENFHDLLTAADVMRDLDIEWGAGPGKHGIGQAMYLYVHDPGSGHRVELYSGGHLIFDPDWHELEWNPTMEWGATWYGHSLDTGPGGSFLTTTPSAGL